MKKFIELSDADLDLITGGDDRFQQAYKLKDAYHELRAHHIEETTMLIGKLVGLRTMIQNEADRITNQVDGHEQLAVLIGASAGSALAGAVLLGREIAQRLRVIAGGTSEGRTKESDPTP